MKKDGVTTTYEILKVFPFTSERKAMSIIVRKPDGRMFIFAKGADSSMLAFSD
jgi:phospholipid-translocating ATPase